MNRLQTRWLAAGGGVLAVVVIAAVAFTALRSGAPQASPSPSPSPSELPSPTASPSPTPEPTLNADLLSRRLTVLVIGLDSSQARRDRNAPVNSDTLMLASLSADQSELTLVSLPRDAVDIPMPDGSTWQRKVNAIYATEGVDRLVGAMQELYRVPIDGYAYVDMNDLAALVDAVGGVDVDPAAPLVDHRKHLDIPAGPQHLDGDTALLYVRTRVDTDFGRAARQQEVLLELVHRLVDPQTDVDLGQLLDGLNTFGTDLPLRDIPTFLELARRAQHATVNGEVLGPAYQTFQGDRGDGRGYIIQMNLDAVRGFVAATIGSDD